MNSMLYVACVVMLYLDVRACNPSSMARVPAGMRAEVERQLKTGEPMDCDQFQDRPALYNGCVSMMQAHEKAQGAADKAEPPPPPAPVQDPNPPAATDKDTDVASAINDARDVNNVDDTNDADDTNEADVVDDTNDVEDNNVNVATAVEEPGDVDKQNDEPVNDDGSETNNAYPTPIGRARRDINAVGHCENGWIRYEDSCYLRNRELRTWFAAKSFCASQEAELWVADSSEEWDTIRDFATINQWTWLGLVNTAIHETTGGEKMEVNGPEWVNRKTSNGGMNYRDLPWLSKASGFGHINNFNCVAYWGNPNLKLSTIHWYNCELPPRQVICERNSTSQSTLVANKALETIGVNRVLEKRALTTTPNPTASSTATEYFSNATTEAVSEVVLALNETESAVTEDPAAKATASVKQ